MVAPRTHVVTAQPMLQQNSHYTRDDPVAQWIKQHYRLITDRSSVCLIFDCEMKFDVREAVNGNLLVPCRVMQQFNGRINLLVRV